MIGQLARSMSPPDAEVLSQQDVADSMGTSLAECFRQGIGPAAWDGVAVARGEGFRLEDIRTEVLIWHGEIDRNDAVAMAYAQERRLPHVSARYYASEGHLIFFSHIAEISPDSPRADRLAGCADAALLPSRRSGSAELTRPFRDDDNELGGRGRVTWVDQSASARRATASMWYLVTFPMTAMPTPRDG